MKRIIIIDYSRSTKLENKAENVLVLTVPHGCKLEEYVKVARRMRADEIIIM